MGILSRLKGKKSVAKQYRQAEARDQRTRKDIEYQKSRNEERLKAARERGRAHARRPSVKRRVAGGLVRAGRHVYEAQKGRSQRRVTVRRTRRRVTRPPRPRVVYVDRREVRRKARKKRPPGFDPTRNPYLS